MKKFSELPEQEQDKWITALKALDGTLVCMCVWEAWEYGTMSKSDFIDPVDDEDFVFERAIEIYKATEAIQSENARLREALEEAVLQIEYLHEKFNETGSGNNVLSIIKKALEQ